MVSAYFYWNKLTLTGIILYNYDTLYNNGINVELPSDKEGRE